MTISRAIAIALVGLSIGFSATSANAGILGDIVGKVGSKVVERVKNKNGAPAQTKQQPQQPQQQQTQQSAPKLNGTKYAACVKLWASDPKVNLQNPVHAKRVDAECQVYARS